MREQDADADPWATTGARLATFARLHAEGAVSEVPCQACGYPTLPVHGGSHICVVCHWQDDGSSRNQPDRRSTVNHGLTLRQAAVHIAENGVFTSRWHALTAPEYFVSTVETARANLMSAYDRLQADPLNASVRDDVLARRTRFMYTIVSAMG